MKIYGDYTFILDKLNIKNNSQVQTFKNGTKIVEFADQFLEEQRAATPDRVSIHRRAWGMSGISWPRLGTMWSI